MMLSRSVRAVRPSLVRCVANTANEHLTPAQAARIRKAAQKLEEPHSFYTGANVHSPSEIDHTQIDALWARRAKNLRTKSVPIAIKSIIFGAVSMMIGKSFFENKPALAEEKQAGSGLDPNSFKPLKLISIKDYNHNTKIFEFELPNKNASLDLPVSSFVLAKTMIDGKEVIRPYTPIRQDEKGKLSLLIKVYPTGVLTKHIFSLTVGNSLDIKGPIPKLKYTANMKKQVGMIAGGTGITPMLQVVQEVLKNSEDKTRVALVFANIGDKDILLKEELDRLAAKHKNFSVHYVLEKPPAGFNGSVGFVTEGVLKKTLPPPSADTLVYVCGPPGMMNAISGPKAKDFSQGDLSGALAKLGYNKDQVFKF